MLQTKGLTKQFDATIALQDFDFSLGKAEIVSIVGENGAGKSTLMKLLSGVHKPSSGEIFVDGVAVHFRNPTEAIRAGIAMVHQELNLIPTLSVEDNIFLGREIGGVSVDRKTTRARSSALLQSVGAKFLPSVMCGELSIAEQQLVEIAKALAEDARLVIFDEPTAVLSEVESARLFDLIRGLREKGVSVLYVSHRLQEILDLCDRVVVLRDGKKVGEVATGELDVQDLANLMVGRALEDIFPAKNEPSSEVVFSVEGLEVPGFAHGISFTLHRGEILGLGGLIGSGRTETCEAIVGLRRRTQGEVKLHGQEVSATKFVQAIGAGLGYVSEDRKGKGLVTIMSVDDNVNLATLDRYPSPSARLEQSIRWIAKLGIKVADPRQLIKSLSGGNQQKVSIAKWLATDPEVLILDEPTRGVDVGAKAEIYHLISELAKDGLACIVISSEMPELIGLCHRVVVLREGVVQGELTGEAISESGLMRLAAGIKSGAAS